MTRVISKLFLHGRLQFQGKFSKFKPKWQSFRFSSTSQSASLDDPKLWVKSPLPDVPLCTGVEMHEMIFEQISKFGNLPAMVNRNNTKYELHL